MNNKISYFVVISIFLLSACSNSTTPLNQTDPPAFNLPVLNADQRVTVKPFGIKVAPGNSPAAHERFRGFHTGTDFEIDDALPAENATVHAICDGPLTFKQGIKGYGGVITQRCLINNEVVTVIYGHVDLFTVKKKRGDELATGDEIGTVGRAPVGGVEGGRRHLHLGIRKGTRLDLRAYVTNEKELSKWLNPQEILFQTQSLK